MDLLSCVDYHLHDDEVLYKLQGRSYKGYTNLVNWSQKSRLMKLKLLYGLTFILMITFGVGDERISCLLTLQLIIFQQYFSDFIYEK